MLNDRPNIFEFAPRELSQDAVFCYILDCFNCPDKRHLAVDFLERIHFPSDAIERIRIRRQEDKIGVKATVDYQDGSRKFLIIEDKVYTSEHDNQLRRYKDATLKREKCAPEDVFGLYFKVGQPTPWELTVCENAGYGILEYTDFLNYTEKAAESDGCLRTFYEFFRHRCAFYRMIDTCKFEDLDDATFCDILSNRYGQRKVMQWMMKGIFGPLFNERKLNEVNNFGKPCTQYRFLFDRSSTPAEWGLTPAEFPQRSYDCFFRIDHSPQGWYISIRQYFRNGTTDEETKFSALTRAMVLREMGLEKDESGNRAASKEKTLVLFHMDSPKTAKELIPRLTRAVGYLLNNK